MGLVLYILAWIIEIPVYFINFFTVFLMDVKKRSWFKTTNDYFFQGAIARDKFGNYNYRRSLNLYLTKTAIVTTHYDYKYELFPYQFGNINETISSALGKNQMQKTLTLLGWFIVYLLWAIDFKYWFKGGHCVNSINYDL